MHLFDDKDEWIETLIRKHEKHARVITLREHPQWHWKHNFKERNMRRKFSAIDDGDYFSSAFQRCQKAISSSKWLTMKFRQQASFALRQFSSFSLKSLAICAKSRNLRLPKAIWTTQTKRTTPLRILITKLIKTSKLKSSYESRAPAREIVLK